MENCSTHRDGRARSTMLPTKLPRSSSTEFPSGPERLPCCCSLFGCGVSETLGGNTGRGDRTPAKAPDTSTQGCGLQTGKTYCRRNRSFPQQLSLRVYVYVRLRHELLFIWFRTTIAVAMCLIPTCCTWSSQVLLDSSSLLDSQTVVCPRGNGGGNSESEHIFSPEYGPWNQAIC